MQAPSLYSYFDSKHAIYDTMCPRKLAQQFVDAEPPLVPAEPLDGLKAIVHYFSTFCWEDFARYQLLFQRTIPGFEPSPVVRDLRTQPRPTRRPPRGVWRHRSPRPRPVHRDRHGPRRPADRQRYRRRSVDRADRRRRRDVLRAHHQDGTTNESKADDMMQSHTSRRSRPSARRSGRARARRCAAGVADQLRTLAPEDWEKPTDCPAWDVHAMAGHSAGMMSDFTSYRALFRRMRTATAAAKKTGGPVIDSMTAAQVADNADLSTAQLVAKVDETGPRAARWHGARAGALPPHAHERGNWRPARDLEDGIPTRHRPHTGSVDAPCRRRPRNRTRPRPHRPARRPADRRRRRRVGATPRPTVHPHADRHCRRCVRRRTHAGEDITIDAVEFCRVLSGHAPGHGLLAQEVPF